MIETIFWAAVVLLVPVWAAFECQRDIGRWIDSLYDRWWPVPPRAQISKAVHAGMQRKTDRMILEAFNPGKPSAYREAVHRSVSGDQSRP